MVSVTAIEYFAFLITLFVSTLDCTVVEVKTEDGQSLNYCSFFQNRAPTPQPNLKNCTWYKERSCCLQQEIDATFATMKPLIGSSSECQRYINYLMCYICAPNQNTFYMMRVFWVCQSFCDRLFAACRTAELKGTVIAELYNDGTSFCTSRRFNVSTDATKCFFYEGSQTSSANISMNDFNIFTIYCFVLMYFYINA